jgi:DNA-binding PadR family transcriptional regulator
MGYYMTSIIYDFLDDKTNNSFYSQKFRHLCTGSYESGFRIYSGSCYQLLKEHEKDGYIKIIKSTKHITYHYVSVELTELGRTVLELIKL